MHGGAVYTFAPTIRLHLGVKTETMRFRRRRNKLSLAEPSETRTTARRAAHARGAAACSMTLSTGHYHSDPRERAPAHARDDAHISKSETGVALTHAEFAWVML